jgi:hypothetical protein
VAQGRFREGEYIKSYKRLLEILADLEHQQWEHWSKTIARSLEKIIKLLNENKTQEAVGWLESIIKNWEKNWKPYKKLPEDIKDFDREWAEKVLDYVPIKCPMWQCGGFMEAKERRPPKGFTRDEAEYDGDWQSPDLVCVNCGAIYRFGGFKLRK